MACSGEMINCEVCQCRHPADFACEDSGMFDYLHAKPLPNAHLYEPFRSILNAFAAIPAKLRGHD